jgi:two-component system response regulator
MDGREVLAEMAKDERLKCLPVVVLTTSAAEKDILNAYRLKCSSYVVKPIDFQEFSRTIQEIIDYWFMLVSLPTKCRTFTAR